jgi:hypothetical protein
VAKRIANVMAVIESGTAAPAVLLERLTALQARQRELDEEADSLRPVPGSPRR